LYVSSGQEPHCSVEALYPYFGEQRQSSAPLLDSLKLGHTAHATDPHTAVKNPASQSKHESSPAAVLAKPGSHGAHSSNSTKKLPAEQMQAVAALKLSEPAWHGRHASFP